MLGVFGNHRAKKLIPVPYDGGTYKRDNGRTPSPQFLQAIQAIKNIPTKANIKSALKAELAMLPLPNNAPAPHYALTHLEKLKLLLKPLLEASYMSMAEAEEVAKQFALEMDTELSNENTYVYFDMMSGFPLVVHRGSVDLINDWLISDVLIATGLSRLINPRISMAQELVKKVEEKYQKPSDGFGHSLGSNVAENSGASGYILTYNKASGLGDIRRKTNPNQIDYRSPKDIVSLISETQDTTIKYVGEDAGFLEAHGLSILPTMAERRV
jgi:hypothetical protein